MANPLSITLLPEASVTASGSGDAVDITAARSAARLRFRVTAISAGGLRVFVDTSADGIANWSQRAEHSLSSAADLNFTVGDLLQFVRARWALVGAASGITAGLAGEAHQLYCSPADLSRYGLPDSVISDLAASLPDRVDACLAATDEAEGYLASRYTMPLSAWGEAVRLHTSKLAIVSFLDRAGWQHDGPDNVIQGAYDRAIAWLKGVAAGAIQPQGVVDATPEVDDSSVAHVFGNTPRGW